MYIKHLISTKGRSKCRLKSMFGNISQRTPKLYNEMSHRHMYTYVHVCIYTCRIYLMLDIYTYIRRIL